MGGWRLFVCVCVCVRARVVVVVPFFCFRFCLFLIFDGP